MLTEREIVKIMIDRGYIEASNTTDREGIIAIQFIHLSKGINCVYTMRTHSYKFIYYTRNGGFKLESRELSGIELIEHFKMVEGMFLKYISALRDVEDKMIWEK